MQTKWTPGPWKPFDIEKTTTNDPSVWSKRHCIATIWINDTSNRRAIANATLIAAAPAMYEALEPFAHFGNDEVWRPTVWFGTPDSQAVQISQETGAKITLADFKRALSVLRIASGVAI